MTQSSPIDEDYNHVKNETEESKLARMEEEAKKARERAEGIRMFEDLSHRIGSGDTWFDIPPPPPTSPTPVKGNNNKNNKSTTEEKKKLAVPTYKYSKLGKGDLYESVILGGIPTFLRYDEANEKIVPYQSIEEETRILRPPSLEEYPYAPYEFNSLEELDEYLGYAKKQFIDSLYDLALNFIKLYNDQDVKKFSLPLM